MGKITIEEIEEKIVAASKMTEDELIDSFTKFVRSRAEKIIAAYNPENSTESESHAVKLFIDIIAPTIADASELPADAEKKIDVLFNGLKGIMMEAVIEYKLLATAIAMVGMLKRK